MEYKDDEGNMLYGYSQTNLQDNTKIVQENSKKIDALIVWLKIVFFMGVGFATIGLMMVTYIIVKYEILVRAVNVLLSTN